LPYPFAPAIELSGAPNFVIVLATISALFCDKIMFLSASPVLSVYPPNLNCAAGNALKIGHIF
jgi:hypothetical protein